MTVHIIFIEEILVRNLLFQVIKYSQLLDYLSCTFEHI